MVRQAGDMVVLIGSVDGGGRRRSKALGGIVEDALCPGPAVYQRAGPDIFYPRLQGRRTVGSVLLSWTGIRPCPQTASEVAILVLRLRCHGRLHVNDGLGCRPPHEVMAHCRGQGKKSNIMSFLCGQMGKKKRGSLSI